MSVQTLQDEEAGFYRALQENHLTAFWRAIAPLQREAPLRSVRPHLWRWQQVQPLVKASGRLVGPDTGAERRVLVFAHPDLTGTTTSTMIASLQLVLPGEVAPSHRHTMAAIRFIISGSGAYTDVDGERIPVGPGDLILTPSWTWHDHGNGTDDPVIWLDGLDSPLCRALAADFFQPDARERQQAITRAAEHSRRRVGSGLLRPAGGFSERALPLAYRWADVEAELRRQVEAGEGDPFDGNLLHYVNPITGGPTLPTMDCRVQWLRPGLQTRSHRHTGNTVYHVARGGGETLLEGEERLKWTVGDTFALPAWQWHAHCSSGGGEAILFSFTDQPVVEALGLYREEVR